MSATTNPSAILARWYRPLADADGAVSLAVVEEPLADVAVVRGRLEGARVSVETRAVLVEVASDGSLFGRPVDPLVPRDGTLCFDPSQGGVRTRENRRARGAFNALVAEANRFAMVNAYVHADVAVRYANGLLADLGAKPLPALRVVVGAHSGSRLPGYGANDGDLRTGELRPLSGGHYRLSSRTSVVPEPIPVAADGEIHLGPSRYRKPFAGWASYLRNAAHNPAIVFHEVGHHLCRHTADFRCNSERPTGLQRNGKPGIEEGISDYFAAVLLGSGRPYGWYRADRGRRRDMETTRSATLDVEDAHSTGAVWAAAFWRCRAVLVEKNAIPSARAHDRALVASLLHIGRIGNGEVRRHRKRREARRCDPSTMLTSYFSALSATGGPRAVDIARGVFDRAALPAPLSSVGERTAC